MLILSRKNGDPHASEMHAKRSPTRFDQGATTHYQVARYGGAWALLEVHIDPDEVQLERRTETLLAVYQSEQEAERAALHLLALDGDEAEPYQRGRHNRGKMMVFPAIGGKS